MWDLIVSVPDHCLSFCFTLYSCPQEVKEAAYNGLVRPVLDYGSSVWDSPGVVLQEELESVQKHAVRFVTGTSVFTIMKLGV